MKHAIAMSAGLLAASLIAASAQAADADLRLACIGQIDRKPGLFDGPSNSKAADQLDFEMKDGAARARFPRKIRPAGMPNDGWADIKDLSVTDDQITGIVKLGIMTKPKIAIDRRTGSVSVRGAIGDFFGTCQAFKGSERAF